MKRRPTVTRIRQRLDYDQHTGLLRWRVTPGGGPKAGDIAGCVAENYVIVGFDGLLYRAHVLAWVWMTGSWPTGDIDHKNGDGHANWWLNLRDVQHKVNNQNERKARSSNKAGLLGVSRHKNGRFRATIVVDARQTHLGYFSTAEQAHAAYVEAKKSLHDGCTL